METTRVAQAWEIADVTDDFDRDLDKWLDDTEGRLAPVGRQTPQVPDDDVVTEEADHLTSHPATLAALEPGQESVGLVRREAQLVAHRHELVRTEALVTVMKELASELRSVRRDVDQIKAVIAKMGMLTDAQKRAVSPTAGHLPPPE